MSRSSADDERDGERRSPNAAVSRKPRRDFAVEPLAQEAAYPRMALDRARWVDARRPATPTTAKPDARRRAERQRHDDERHAHVRSDRGGPATRRTPRPARGPRRRSTSERWCIPAYVRAHPTIDDDGGDDHDADDAHDPVLDVPPDDDDDREVHGRRRGVPGRPAAGDRRLLEPRHVGARPPDEPGHDDERRGLEDQRQHDHRHVAPRSPDRQDRRRRRSPSR